MLTFSFTPEDPAGVHARPAGLFVREAVKLPVSVQIVFRGKTADGKRLLDFCGLGIGQGETFRVCIEGESRQEEERAREILRNILTENMLMHE